MKRLTNLTEASRACLLEMSTPDKEPVLVSPWVRCDGDGRLSLRAISTLVAMLGLLGSFSIDTYIPAFSGVAHSIGASPAEMQQTLSAYLFGFAFMSLFHGALSDSFGRRPVLLWSLAFFTASSLGCMLAHSVVELIAFRALQGLSSGAGLVVSRALIRDMFSPAEARKLMSRIMIYFGIAPALAPVIGGVLFEHFGWQSIFAFLAAVGGTLFIATRSLVRESLAPGERTQFSAGPLMRGYWSMCSNHRFLLLALASALPFNGALLYVLAAPSFLGEQLGLAPTQYFWLFAGNIGGIVAGAMIGTRLMDEVGPQRQIWLGFLVMGTASFANVTANMLFAPHASWSLLPLILFAAGWALIAPSINVLVLDIHPGRRGMASSLQAAIGVASNAAVASLVTPLVMHSSLALALSSLGLYLIGACAWLGLRSADAAATMADAPVRMADRRG